MGDIDVAPPLLLISRAGGLRITSNIDADQIITYGLTSNSVRAPIRQTGPRLCAIIFKLTKTSRPNQSVNFLPCRSSCSAHSPQWRGWSSLYLDLGGSEPSGLSGL